jgi:hypothetical protein
MVALGLIVLINLLAVAVLSLGVFLATRNLKTKPSLYTIVVFCWLALWLARVVYDFWRTT